MVLRSGLKRMDKYSKEYFVLCLSVYNKSLEWQQKKAKMNEVNHWIDAQANSEVVREVVKLRQKNIRKFKHGKV